MSNKRWPQSFNAPDDEGTRLEMVGDMRYQERRDREQQLIIGLHALALTLDMHGATIQDEATRACIEAVALVANDCKVYLEAHRE